MTATLLPLLDAGRLTDAHGRSVDATHAVVILTSNLGAELILGAPGGNVEAVREQVLALARVVLRPELVNRVDEVVLFAPLSTAALAAITATVLAETTQRLATQGVGLVVSEAALAWLAVRGSGGPNRSPESGARPLRRTVAREVDRQLSRMLLAGQIAAGDEVRVDVASDAAPDGDGSGRSRSPCTDGPAAMTAPEAGRARTGGIRRSGAAAGASSSPAPWCGRGTTTSSARRPRPRSGRRCRCRRCCWGCSAS